MRIILISIALLLLPFSVPAEGEQIIFAPDFMGEEPSAVLMNASSFPEGTKVRIAIFSGDKICSRIWNGNRWVSSNSSWADMPEVSDRIFVVFYPYSDCTLSSVTSLRIRFRTGNKTTDWIERSLTPVALQQGAGVLEGYAEENGKPLENEEIRIYRKSELFAVSLTEENLIYDTGGKGHFRITLPPGSYSLRYGKKAIPFVIGSRETTGINIEASDVRINEFFYPGSGEWIELKNFESKPVSLEGWYITDRDNFNISLSGEISGLRLIDLFSLYDKAVLTDTGDDVMLVDDFGRVADFLGHGGSAYVDTAPAGFSVLDIVCAENESIALMNGSYAPSEPTRGMENDLEIKKQFAYGKAEPFLSPDDSFERVMGLLGSAKKRVYISTYKFSSLPVYYALLDLQKNGVDVRLMLGQQSSINLEVPYVIVRKPLNHAKYAVIDDSFLVSSENFDEGGMPAGEGNRGWWILLKESDIDLRNLFALDWNNALGSPLGSEELHRITGTKKGKLLISPENSFPEIIGLIESAKRSIYAEQLYIKNADIIKALEGASESGVRVTLVLDDRSNLSIEGAELSFFPDMHNKGIIIDESAVLVSSINLSDESLFENREVGVVLYDDGVVKYLYGERIA